jgi:hypothetical protein
MTSDGHPKLFHFVVFVAVLSFATLGFLMLSKEYEPQLEAQSAGLVNHWMFEEFSSGPVDVVGGINGTRQPVSGGPVYDSNGKVDNALRFDGVDDYIDLGDNLNLQYPFTFSGWVRVDGSSAPGTDMPIFATDDEANYTGLQVMLETENETYQVVVDLMNGQGQGPAYRSSKSSSGGIPNGSWAHIAAVVEAPGDIDIYINCVNAGGTYSGTASAASLTPLPHTTAPARFAKRQTGAGGFFHGALDDVKIYNRALTPSELCTAYQQTPDFLFRVSNVQLCPGNRAVIDWMVPYRNLLSFGNDPGVATFIPPGVQGMTYEATSRAVWAVTDNGSSQKTLQKIDAISAQVVSSWINPTFPLSQPTALTSSPGFIWIGDSGASLIRKVPVGAPLTATTIAFPHPIRSLSFDPNTGTEGTLWVGVSQGSNAGVYLVDVASGVVGTEKGDNNTAPDKMLYNPITQTMWALSASPNALQEFSSNGTINKTIALGSFTSANDMALDPTATSLWLTRNTSSNNLLSVGNLSSASPTLATFSSSVGFLGIVPDHSSVPRMWLVRSTGVTDMPLLSSAVPQVPNASVMSLPEANSGTVFVLRDNESHSAVWLAYQDSATQIVRKIPVFLGGPMTNCTKSSNNDSAWAGGMSVPAQNIQYTAFSPIGGVTGDTEYRLSCVGSGGAKEKIVIVESLSSGHPACAPAVPAVCSDGIDNDGDELIDYPADLGCQNSSGLSELNSVCGNGRCERSLGETPLLCSSDCFFRLLKHF